MEENDGRMVCKYLCESMPIDEKKELKHQLEEDEALHQELVFYKELREAVSDDDVMAYRSQIGDLFEKKKQEGSRGSPGRWYRRRTPAMALAAGFTLLLVVVSLVYMTRGISGNQGQKVFREHYQTYPAVVQTRSAGEREAGLRREAFRLYEKQEWAAAGDAFEQVLAQDKSSVEAHFYMALVQLEMDREEKALYHFEEVIFDGPSLYYDQALWYSGLTLMKAGRLEEAEPFFRKLKRQKGWKSEEAASILKTFV
jgi:tetratricopeptide (TPR) repeat protein